MATGASFGAFARKPRGPGVSAQAGTADDGVQDGVEPADLIELGVIGEAYGVHGWVKVFPHAQAGLSGSALLDARRWWLVRGDVRRSVAVEASKVHIHAVVAQLAGCADRTAAEALKGFRVYARRADFGQPAENEYYWVDLIGARVVNTAGASLGMVAGLLDNSAHAVLRVTPDEADAAERLIPFVEAYVREVDLAQAKIVVDWELDY